MKIANRPKWTKKPWLRAAIYRRDGFACCHCGWRPPNIPDDPMAYDGMEALWTVEERQHGRRVGRSLDIDHIIPRRAGGRNVIENLQCLCTTCNNAKIKTDRVLFPMTHSSDGT